MGKVLIPHKIGVRAIVKLVIKEQTKLPKKKRQLPSKRNMKVVKSLAIPKAQDKGKGKKGEFTSRNVRSP